MSRPSASAAASCPSLSHSGRRTPSSTIVTTPSPPREAPGAVGTIAAKVFSSFPSPSAVPDPIFCWRPRTIASPSAEWLEPPERQAIRIQALLRDVTAYLWHLPSDTAIDVTFLAEGTWNRAFLVELPGVARDSHNHQGTNGYRKHHDIERPHQQHIARDNGLDKHNKVGEPILQHQPLKEQQPNGSPGDMHSDRGINSRPTNKFSESVQLRQNGAGNPHDDPAYLAVPGHKQTKPACLPYSSASMDQDDHNMDIDPQTHHNINSHHYHHHHHHQREQEEEKQLPNGTEDTHDDGSTSSRLLHKYIEPVCLPHSSNDAIQGDQSSPGHGQHSHPVYERQPQEEQQPNGTHKPYDSRVGAGHLHHNHTEYGRQQRQNGTDSTLRNNGVTGDNPLRRDPEPVCQRLVFRIALPVLPSRKVRSEVATMRWAREGIATPIPVPRVFLYDASVYNAVGYEWILMEHMDGRPYRDVRESLPLETKRTLARTIAEWAHGLSQHRFDAIGSLYKVEDDTPPGGGLLPQHPSLVQVEPLYGKGTVVPPLPPPPRVRIGPLCSQLFMGDWRAEYPVSHGPFRDLASYCLSLARLAQYEIRDDRQYQRARLNHLDLCVELRQYAQRQRPADTQLVQQIADLDAERARLRQRLEAYPHVAGPRCEALSSAAGQVGDAPALLARAGPRPRTGEGLPHPNGAAENDDDGLLTAVAFKGSTYDFRQWDKHAAAVETLVPLVERTVPATPLPPRSTVLWHWDMSENNVLVDPATGRPTALLDWEQLYATPLVSLLRGARPPSLMAGEDAENSDMAVGPWLPLPPLVRPAPGYSVSYLEERPDGEDPGLLEAWELQEMQAAYRERLRELADPRSSSAAPLLRHPDNPDRVHAVTAGPPQLYARPEAVKPEEEVGKGGRSMVAKVVDLVTRYWIRPRDIEDLVAVSKGEK